MTRSIRVAHLIHSLGPGGAENVLVDLAGAAPAAGLEIVVLGLSPVPDPVHARTLRTLGVPVVQLDLPLWDVRAVRRAVGALREHDVALVHTHLKHADLVGAGAAMRLGLPQVSTLHLIEDVPPRRIDRYKRSAGLLARRRFATCTIALSAAQRAWYCELAGTDDRLTVLPNGVADPGEPAPGDGDRLRAELGLPDGQLLVVSASLMRPEKGHHLLLDAVRLLPDAFPVTVLVAGDGPLRAELEARTAADDALRHRVRFLGYRDDVPALLAAADLVLHTSLADALPTTLIHASAAGVPAVATDVGGIPDIVTADTGLVVPTRADDIARAVLELGRDPDRCARLGAAARTRFVERFEAVGWAHRLRTVYENVLR